MVKSPKGLLRKNVGRKNQSKDISRIKIMRFLKSGPSNRNRINLSKGMSGMPHNAMTNILDEMCEWKWINKKQSEDVANVKMYSLADLGRTVLDKTDEIKFEEFFKLDFFQGIKSEF
jgi:DNA-binding HxlR family transcriptional regulator